MVVDKGNRISTTEKYFGAAEDHIHWKMERLLKPFDSTSFHRTLTEYFNALYKNRLLVRRLVEPQPTRQGIKKHSPLKEVLFRPHSVIVEAIKEPI